MYFLTGGYKINLILSIKWISFHSESQKRGYKVKSISISLVPVVEGKQLVEIVTNRQLEYKRLVKIRLFY